MKSLKVLIRFLDGGGLDSIEVSFSLKNIIYNIKKWLKKIEMKAYLAFIVLEIWIC